MAVAAFLIDKSAYARLHHRAVFDRLAPLIERGLVASRSMVDLEILFSTMLRAVGIPDLLIAAVAERHRVILLHYDRDFDHVGRVTGQRLEWVAQAGTVP